MLRGSCLLSLLQNPKALQNQLSASQLRATFCPEVTPKQLARQLCSYYTPVQEPRAPRNGEKGCRVLGSSNSSAKLLENWEGR